MAKTCVGDNQIKKIYVGDQKIKKAYVGSELVFSAESVLFQNGSTEDSGTWGAYKTTYGTAPTIGSTISYPHMSNNSWYGSLASTSKPISLSGSHKLSFDMTVCNYSLQDTNMAPGAKWGVRIYALFSKSQIVPSGYIGDSITWAESFDEYMVCNGYKTYGPDPMSGSIAAGTKTIDINLTGDYYFGILVAGYNTQINGFTVNNIKIE